MPDRQDDRDRNAPDDNPLGLGSRGRESANTGSTEDTSYDAHGSDPYTTGEPRKDFSGVGRDEERDPGRSRPADPETSSSDEP